MSVRAIEAEVSIKSGVQAECTIGREVIRTVYVDPVLESLSVTENGTYEPSEGIDGYDRVVVDVPPTIPDIEPLTVTANGVYTAEGDGFNPVTVNVEAPKDPNICEGEFIGTETGVLTIDLQYTGDDFPKAIMIHAADGIVKDDLNRPYVILAYCIFKNTYGEPTYDGNDANNAFKCQSIYVSTGTYVTWSGNSVYTFSQTDPSMGFLNSVRMPDNKTLKIYISSGSQYNAKFTTGIRYKYQVFY